MNYIVFHTKDILIKDFLDSILSVRKIHAILLDDLLKIIKIKYPGTVYSIFTQNEYHVLASKDALNGFSYILNGDNMVRDIKAALKEE